MRILLQLIINTYSVLLNLYPPGFRDEFAAEMFIVFRDSVVYAAKEGVLPVISVCVRELLNLPFNILREIWHEGLEPALILRTVKEGTVETLRKMWWVDVGSWQATLASLLPLWLLTSAFLPVGGPSQLAVAAFVLAIASCIFLLWKGWMTFELVLYSLLFPFILIFTHDEESAAYKIPLFLLCTLVLTIGIIGYHYSLYRDAVGAAWLILLFVFIATWVFTLHAHQNYWQLADELGYNACDSQGCVPLAPTGTSWWILFCRVIRGS